MPPCRWCVRYRTTAVRIEEEIGAILRERGMRLATAESCTGGLLGHLITNVPGSSDYYDRGVVTYSDAAKEELLGVARGILERHGAVSEEAARAMAEGLRRASRADVAVSITGIAGPSGGSRQKPIGLVYIALATPKGTRCIRNQFCGNREDIKRHSALKALELILHYLTDDTPAEAR